MRFIENLFREQEPEELLLYADTEIHEISKTKQLVTIKGTDFSETPYLLAFTEDSLFQRPQEETLQEEILRIEEGKLVEFCNGRKRLFLFNDDRELVLEIEFEKCQKE